MKRAALPLALLVGLALRCAWLGDDAFITLRTVDNFVHGFGLRWNVAERVQAFTHPLWLFVLVPLYAITREVLFTVALASLATAAAAYAVLTLRVRSVVLPLVLACSRTVITFSTSGLEGPLALLLLALLLARTERATWRDALLLSLVMLTRTDLGLVAAPLVLARRPTLRALAIGLLPLVAWELFSLFYYGSLVPNTAYAKLSTGISRATLMGQGARYVESLGLWDPVGALLLVTGTLTALVRRRALGLGLVGYALYVVWIGGDFMAGRFFYVPIALAASCLCERPRAWLALPIAIPLVWLGHPLQWIRLEGAKFDRWGIVDERMAWAPDTGLFASPHPHQHLADRRLGYGRYLALHRVVSDFSTGMDGFFAGPHPFIVDLYGLSDPLLARLPIIHVDKFRIGHFERTPPAGYMDSLRSDEPKLTDPDLDAYYRIIYSVTRDPLWSWSRLRNVAKLVSGRAEPLREAYVARCATTKR